MRRGTVALAGLLFATTASVSGPAAAESGRPPGEPGDVGALLTELRALHQQTGAATEAFNETEERLVEQRAEVDRLTARLADTRSGLADARRTAGALAAAQYRHGGAADLPPVLRLLLTGDDPARALHDGTVARRAASAQLAEISRLTEAESQAAGLAGEATAALDEQRTLVERQRAQRDEAHRRLDEVAGLLAGLDEERLTELATLEERTTAEAQREFLAEHPPTDDRPGSAAGQRALDWALAQRGKPYEVGAEGPDAFDPAGLAMRAWEHAGATVPRTSARAWERLPRVPLDQLQPGDLVIYHDDASHIAVYAGEGSVVHPPAPGEPVAVTPLAVLPVQGAVRPTTRA
ncbi:C40 family peptidase [Streptomyces profundus]|uniref:C40 family peptidase n=1 Tax=Streptomyces profundus TaxID=2867410 RepID=UPI001D15F315|nr:NlpC/P60 family protein [Streptomyces sp. MA3_2.13]UED84200.1 C40 family peptidase [Streptomyces sp. MA3_2.13]